ncbi:MAG: cytochrome c oxidase subunit II [Micrococcales bacterium]
MLSKRGLKWAAVPAAASLLMLTGCSAEDLKTGYLPGSGNTTNHTSSIVGLWNSSWIVLLAVGVISWGLMAFALIAYRRRRGETGLPVQLRYNMPIETLFTVVPFILVIGFFAFTAKTMTAIETENNPEVTIQVVGKQWSWDFNYVNANVFDAGIQYQDGPNAQTEAALPTLYLPIDKRVEIDLTSRDVIHSFWVIDFLYKKDMFPGKTNRMYFTPTELGTFKGKCAELCGEFHSAMLFNVKVVTQAEYDKHLADLAAAGNIGQLDLTYQRNSNLPGNKAPQD